MPQKTGEQRKEYRLFRKFLKNEGYVLLQKSVYVKLIKDSRHIGQSIRLLNANAPEKGNIAAIPLGINEFCKMKTIAGNRFNIEFFADNLVVV